VGGVDVGTEHIWCLVCREECVLTQPRVHPESSRGFLPVKGQKHILRTVAATHFECLNPVLHLVFSAGCHDVIAEGIKQQFNSTHFTPSTQQSPLPPVCQPGRPGSLSLVPAAFCVNCELIALLPLTCVWCMRGERSAGHAGREDRRWPTYCREEHLHVL